MSAQLDDHLFQGLQLIQSEYYEMPGLHLTKPQVQRLWGLDREGCELVLDTLEAKNFLRRTRTNAYVRADSAC
jgi:hypothetical protein